MLCLLDVHCITHLLCCLYWFQLRWQNGDLSRLQDAEHYLTTVHLRWFTTGWRLVARSLQLLHAYIRTDVRNCSALSRLAYWQAAGNNNYDNLCVLYFLLWMFTLYSTLFQPQSSRTHYILMSVLWYVCFVETTLYIHSVNNNCCHMYWYYLSGAYE